MLLLPAFVGAPEINKVYHCEALTLLRALPSGSVDCCVTSPPYFGLRDYGIAGQIGLEKTPDSDGNNILGISGYVAPPNHVKLVYKNKERTVPGNTLLKITYHLTTD